MPKQKNRPDKESLKKESSILDLFYFYLKKGYPSKNAWDIAQKEKLKQEIESKRTKPSKE